jgi:two-component system sensor histidine kinase KdpD
MMPIGKRALLRYFASVASISAIPLALWPVSDEIDDATAASALLVVVLFVATKWGTGPAITASVLGTVYLNFFFLPPAFRLQLPGGKDLVALVTFLVTAIVVGQLSARAQQKTREAQQLYDRLRDRFDQSSKLEASRQSECLKSALLDAVTHDLRTPLTSIKAAATALMKAKSNPGLNGDNLTPNAQSEFLSMIVDQSDRLNHFIEGMLELAKVRAGNFGDQPSVDAVEEIIGAALARAEAILLHHHVRCTCEDDLMVESVSPRAIAQVIYSIIENSTQHAPQGSEIAISAERAGGDEVRVIVEDEGPGISAEHRHAVFDKFFHLPTPTDGATVVSSGLGLGLAIARGIVEANRGRIWIEDRPDGCCGTRVVFSLKIHEAPTALASNGA